MRVAAILEEGKIGGPQVYTMNLADYLSKSIDTIIIMPHENSEAFQQKCNDLALQYHLVQISRITKELRPALHYILYSPCRRF